MNKELILVLAKRFARAFLAGGLASLTVQLSVSPNPNDLKPWLISLVVAFVSGGIMALEKASRWE